MLVSIETSWRLKGQCSVDHKTSLRPLSPDGLSACCTLSQKLNEIVGEGGAQRWRIVRGNHFPHRQQYSAGTQGVSDPQFPSCSRTDNKGGS
jgi:hypothetical protein